jgi:hypothetical protein
MRSLVLLCAVSLWSCGATSTSDAGVSDAGSSDAGTHDAGIADAGSAWVDRIQPLLHAHCADCHAWDAGLPAFADSYTELRANSQKCPGEPVGTCVSLALQAQVPEGQRCRTVVVVPFHREGWVCLSQADIDTVVTWVDGGMLP